MSYAHGEMVAWSDSERVPNHERRRVAHLGSAFADDSVAKLEGIDARELRFRPICFLLVRRQGERFLEDHLLLR